MASRCEIVARFGKQRTSSQSGCTHFFLEIEGLYPFISEATEQSPSVALAGIVEHLPMGSFWLIYLAVIGLIFVATTYDSASYTLAAGATRSLGEGQDPARWHRVFWAVALGILPLSLLFLGGLKELQTAAVVASIPLIFVYLLLVASIIKMLRSSACDSGQKEPDLLE